MTRVTKRSLLLGWILLLSMQCIACANHADPKRKEVDKVTNCVVLQMENDAEIVIELDPKAAPETVENFQKLVSESFYDGLTFHRAVQRFVIQGGDPRGNGTGDSGATIKGEFEANGVSNPLKHERGVISMARSMDFDSASCQFFIVLETSAGVSRSLDGQYAAFGKVISGMDEVDRIAELPTQGDSIVEQPVIRKAYFIEPNEAAEK